MRSVLVGLLVFFCGVFSPPSAATPCQPAELFVTDNGDPMFESQADATITQGGVAVTGSTPLDGVYWSTALQRLSFGRSREFHVCAAGGPALHNAAEALRRALNQESVLSFDYRAPQDNAMLITVPDVDIARLRDALAADPAARSRLRGGSVSTIDRTLILVADRDDRDLARRLATEAGGDWDAATITDGTSEFVE